MRERWSVRSPLDLCLLTSRDCGGGRRKKIDECVLSSVKYINRKAKDEIRLEQGGIYKKVSSCRL